MSYATRQDLTDAYGEVELLRMTDRNIPTTGAVDWAAVDRALDQAGAMIDSYLDQRYQLPLATVDPALRRAACVLARGYAVGGTGAPGIVVVEWG